MKQILVKNFLSEMEAELAKNMLEARGIKSVIQKEGSALNGGVATGGGLGVDLFVLEKDFEEAKELLDQK